MEEQQYLIDTNTVINYPGNKLPSLGMKYMNDIIDVVPNLSVITKIELFGFNDPDEHYKTLSNFISDSTVLDLTNNVVEASIEIRKKYKTKLPNAIMAPTALVYNLVLISRNIPDFKNINGLKVINPHNL